MDVERLAYFLFIIVFVLFLGLLMTVIIISNIRDNNKREILGQIVDNRIGSSSTGSYESNNGNMIRDGPSCRAVGGTWQLFRCQCPPHRFGDFCDRQVFTNEFKGIGIASNLDQISNQIEEIDADNLSFGAGENCTTLCQDDCAGVYWDGTTCKIIKGDRIIVNPEVDISQKIPIPFSYAKDSNIYGKIDANGGDLVFTQRLYLYTGDLPWRFWLTTGGFKNRTVDMFTMIRGTIYNMSIHPVESLDSLFGVFTESDINTDPLFLKMVIENGFPGYVVLRPGEEVPTIPWENYQGIAVGENGR
ncbi:MAG: hypothetical protein O2U61_05270 [Candidatus Bathyarchaeota archaeon]|nr:hypothetical protein [Candidatus Bathyarchaeota archaeon]